MANTSIFCLTLDPSLEKIIHKLSYIPVGLGDKKPNTFLTDKTGLIFLKNHITENTPFIIGCGRTI